MKKVFSILTIALFTLTLNFNIHSAPVPNGSQLDISFKFMDWNDELRDQGKGDCYGVTAWVEGPYDPSTPCQIINYQRQNINLVKVLEKLATIKTFPEVIPDNGSWGYPDYNTSDFTAAIVTAGMFYRNTMTAEVETTPIPANSTRQDPDSSGYWKNLSSKVADYVNNTWWNFAGDTREIPDGVSSATYYGKINPNVNINWDMRNYNGNLIEEGYYLVYVQLSAERYLRSPEYHMLFNGVNMIDQETCWDDPAYDTVGHHRVVNLFHFKDSSFTLVDSNEKSYIRDVFNKPGLTHYNQKAYYMDGAMDISYQIPASINAYKTSKTSAKITVAPNPFNPSTYIYYNLPEKQKANLSIYSIDGKLVKTIFNGISIRSGKTQWSGENNRGELMPEGIYIYSLQTDKARLTGKLVFSK